MRFKFITILVAAITLSGCSTAIGSTAVGVTNFAGEGQASKRAASALGVAESDLTVTNVQKNGFRTEFMATTSTNNRYNCYVTSQLGITSDAICTPLGGAPALSGKQCNSLLKAAGKC